MLTKVLASRAPRIVDLTNFQELVWQVVNTIKLDPGRRPFLERSPYLERSSRRPGPLCKREDLLPETLVQSASEDGIDPRQYFFSVPASSILRPQLSILYLL